MFNRENRWDEAVPRGNRTGGAGGADPASPKRAAETLGLNEPIEVQAHFKAGEVIPKRFLWRGRVYAVEKLTYHWVDRRGTAAEHHFSVQSGATLYELSFENQHMAWRVVQSQPADESGAS